MSKPLRLGRIGPPCPRCRRATELRKHKTVTAKELRKPFYYTQWYKCMNIYCKTTLIMPPEFRVFRGVAALSATDPTPVLWDEYDVVTL